jgi:hypothetical protein
VFFFFVTLVFFFVFLICFLLFWFFGFFLVVFGLVLQKNYKSFGAKFDPILLIYFFGYIFMWPFLFSRAPNAALGRVLLRTFLVLERSSIS